MLDSYLPTEKEEVTFSIFKAKDLLEYGLGLNFVVAKKISQKNGNKLIKVFFNEKRSFDELKKTFGCIFIT